VAQHGSHAGVDVSELEVSERAQCECGVLQLVEMFDPDLPDEHFSNA
jgi:hypothetical protein